MACSGNCGLVAARAATMASASGSRAHRGDDLGDRARLGGQPVGAEPARQQLLAPRPRVSRSRVSGCAPSTATRPVSWLRLVTTTKQPGRARQQRADLLGVAGVVEHHEHPPAGQHAAVQRGLRVEVGRDPLTGHAERLQQSPRIASAGSITAPLGSNPRRFTYSWPSGNRSADPVRPVHRQRRLADAGGAGDRADHHGGRLPVHGTVQRGREPVEVGLPAGEPGDVGRELGRCRAAGAWIPAAGAVTAGTVGAGTVAAGTTFAAEQNRSRSSPVSPNASASRRTVTGRGFAIRPASIFPMLRTPTPVRSASSSCDSPSRRRSPRTNSPNTAASLGDVEVPTKCR